MVVSYIHKRYPDTVKYMFVFNLSFIPSVKKPWLRKFCAYPAGGSTYERAGPSFSIARYALRGALYSELVTFRQTRYLHIPGMPRVRAPGGLCVRVKLRNYPGATDARATERANAIAACDSQRIILRLNIKRQRLYGSIDRRERIAELINDPRHVPTNPPGSRFSMPRANDLDGIIIGRDALSTKTANTSSAYVRIRR